MVHFQRGEFPEAVACFSAALKIDSSFSKVSYEITEFIHVCIGLDAVGTDLD